MRRSLAIVALVVLVAFSGCLVGFGDDESDEATDSLETDTQAGNVSDTDIEDGDSQANETQSDNATDDGTETDATDEFTTGIEDNYGEIRDALRTPGHYDSLYQFGNYGTISPGEDVRELYRDEQPLPETYTYLGQERSLNEYLNRTNTTSLVVLQNETVVHESYYHGYTSESTPASMSVAKSFTSALVGIAIDEGYIDSVEDESKSYAPVLSDTGFGNATLFDLLTMSSGAGYADSHQTPNLMADVVVGNETLDAHLAAIDPWRPPGTDQRYSNGDTLALGLVLEEATGMPTHEFAQEYLWEPAGMGGEAFWMTDGEDRAITMCCLHAQPLDYARFGLLYLQNGKYDGEAIVPESWVAESTTDQPLRATNESGSLSYGYQWWLPEYDDQNETFAALGVDGQFIVVDPTSDTVVVKTSVDPDSITAEDYAAFDAVVDAIIDGE